MTEGPEDFRGGVGAPCSYHLRGAGEMLDGQRGVNRCLAVRWMMRPPLRFHAALIGFVPPTYLLSTTDNLLDVKEGCPYRAIFLEQQFPQNLRVERVDRHRCSTPLPQPGSQQTDLGQDQLKVLSLVFPILEIL